MTTLLLAKDIEKRYGEHVVFRAERIAVESGDVIIVSGPNGSGKSTLLRVLCGVAPPTAGRIERSHEFDALRLAYVPQEGGLYQNMTVLENYLLWVRLYGHHLSGNRLPSPFLDLGLEPFLRRRVAKLSGGYRKLAALACAVAMEPHGIFLDEPISGLDEDKAQLVLQSLQRVHSRDGFLIMASHAEADLPFAIKGIRVSGGRATCVEPAKSF